MTAGERIAAWIANDADAGEADYAARIDAAIVAAESSALERAAQVFENRGPRIQSGYEAAALLRALASPAAAPAAEPIRTVPMMPVDNAADARMDALRSAQPPETVRPPAPSLLPRVLAVLDAEYRRRGGDDGGGYVGALAAELRRYIAEMEGKT